MHIAPEYLLPQDLVDVLDKGPAGESRIPVCIRMHASDAKHAMDVEPGRYMLLMPEALEPYVEIEPLPSPEKPEDE